MDDDPLDPQREDIERMRRCWKGCLSSLEAPGANQRLRRAMRHPVRLNGVRAGSPPPPLPDGAAVLAKAARYTGAWLGLDDDVFRVATGITFSGSDVPSLDSPAWATCLGLVRLGGRLEARLGRRGMVRAWLRSRHVVLVPTPLAVIGTPGGLQVIADYLGSFDR